MTYILVIDTDQYSGNFERQMVAFMTGEVGECGVGAREAEQFRESFPNKKFDFVEQVPDECGCHRPSKIWKSPYFWNDGYGNHYSVDKPIDNKKEVRYPGYCSVASFFECRPTDEQANFFVDRAKIYCARHKRFDGSPDPITFLGARLIQEIRTEVEVSTFK